MKANHFSPRKITLVTFSMLFLAWTGGIAGNKTGKTMKIKEAKSKNEIGPVRVSQFTTADLQAFKSYRIKATPEKLWETIGDHESIPEWVPMVKHVRVNNSKADDAGVGCERVCTFGGSELTEKVVYQEDGRIMAYSAADNRMASNHLGVIEIIQEGEYSVVNWYQYFDPRGMKGFMMKNMMGGTLKKALKNLEKRSV